MRNLTRPSEFTCGYSLPPWFEVAGFQSLAGSLVWATQTWVERTNIVSNFNCVFMGIGLVFPENRIPRVALLVIIRWRLNLQFPDAPARLGVVKLGHKRLCVCGNGASFFFSTLIRASIGQMS